MTTAARVLALALIPIASASSAQSYPTKPVRIIVPVAAGGGVDNIARAYAVKMTESWRQPVFVENRIGAGTIIGTDFVAKAAPDGHTLLFSSMSVAVNAVLFKKLPFDPLKDIAPVGQITGNSFFMAASPVVGTDVKSLLAAVRAQPNKFNYGSTGPGSIAHLVGEVFRLETAIDVVHVPYKNDAGVIAAMLAGEVHYAFLPSSAVIPQARAGKLHALGVTGRTRSPQHPQLPTMIESGVQNFDFETWVGAFVTGGTPVEIQNRISAEVARVLRLPDIVLRLPVWGGEAIGSSPEEFSKRYRADIARYGKVVREAKVPTLD
ncbi:MAG: tripartite tricarboxylate transporter substrate binding protein [Betaproteobacteria bacterium]|nr:tripartite tricarboxylate transporter substrate binding protein [Betaproteobacteria bacterium]